MEPDPTLTTLIVAGYYPVAADWYEERTGDTELATLLRIDGLVWEMDGGEPSLTLDLAYWEIARNGWWTGWCGTHQLGGGTLVGGGASLCEPNPLGESGVIDVLRAAGFGDRPAGDPLVKRFYDLVCRATVPEAENNV